MKSIGVLLCAVTVAMTATVVGAAAPSLDAALRCGALADRDARLNCYDQLFAKPPATAAAPAAVVPAPATAPASAAAASVGAETLPKPREEKTATAPTMLVARIAAILPLQGSMFRITLDNGQVWETQEGHSSFIIKVGDTVRINKRPMGSYQVAREIDGKPGYPVRAIRQK